MISLNNVGSAGQALHYFSKDNYYTQHEGLAHSEWFGKGAVQLGLIGQIEPHTFQNILVGSIDNQQLGKWIKNPETGKKERQHRPGTDVTFSAPKSVSLLAEVYGQHAVREAHETAVKAALTYIEKNLIHTRSTKDGKTQSLQTGNMVVSLFRHNTSRDLDPQTHTHAVIMNATLRSDGQWRSLVNDEIYHSQRLIGALYTSELAYQLQALGYTIERTDEHGNFEIAGFTPEQLTHFSQRRAEITAALQAKGISIEQASAQQKEDVTLKTRAHKKQVDHAELITTWKERAQSVGIDFQVLQDKAERHQKEGISTLDDPLKGLEAMEFAVEHLIEREAVLYKNDLLETAIKHGVGRVSPSEVEKAFTHLEKMGGVIKLPNNQYTTKRMLSSEKRTLDQIRAQKGQVAKIMATEDVAKRIALAERQQGFAYTEGQKEAISRSLSTQDRYIAIQGLAGTGKTTMLRALREIAQEQGYTVRGMAPTGAASKALAGSTKIAADTVSMFLIKEHALQKDIAFAKQHAPDFTRKCELWIVDESSFLSQYQKADIDAAAQKAGARVVYVGDVLQLQAVEAGKPFELAQKNGIETAYMTEISRQKTTTLKRTVDIVVGRDQLEKGQRLTQVQLHHNARAFAHMDKAGMVHEIEEDPIGAVVKDFLNLSRMERESTIVITAFNKDRTNINSGIRQGLKELGELSSDEEKCEILISKGWTRAKIKEAQYYKAGDVVRFGRNYKNTDLIVKKGEYARVKAIDAAGGTVLLKKADGTTLTWTPKKHNKVEVYDAENRDLAVGDLMRMTRNGEQFKNGDVVRVRSIASQVASLELYKGTEPSLHQVNLSQNPHWDHAYAVTLHSAQGCTQKRTIFHIDAKKEGAYTENKKLEHWAQIFGARSFYVGATRASHTLKIYTNNKAQAAQVISAHQDKTSAVEVIQEAQKSRAAIQKRQQFSR